VQGTDVLTQATTFRLTAEQRQLLPSDEDVRFYAEHGWYLSEKLLSDDEVDSLVRASERFYAGSRDRRLSHRPSRLAYWEPQHGLVQRHNDYIHYEDDTIGQILRKPIIGAVAARLAGADVIRLFQSTLIMKPAEVDEATNTVPWHFDKHYWSTSSSERMLTAFIPLHDCDEEMGTITMIDGSNRWTEIGDRDSVTLHFAHRDRDELEEMLEENAGYNGVEIRKVPMNIRKGHMSFHHCRTYHGSGANRSGRPRRAISLHLQDGENSYCERRLSDGSLTMYNHDELVSRNAAGLPDYADPEFCPVLWHS
jgi:hypothetical protein